MSLANSEALLVLFVVVGLFALNFFLKKQKRPTLQLSQLKILKQISNPWNVRLLYLLDLVKIVSLAFIIFALARPQESSTKVKKNIEGIDIVIALDVSDSMLIEDMKPSNRLESAKETIRKFIEKRSSDRIGLLVFAGEAFTLVPPTLDYQLLLSRIETIKTARDAKIKDGTAIGVAIASAAGRLKDSQAKTRIMIFMTDGENNSGTIDPETGLEIAKGYGIKVYSIGIGKDGPTKLPIYQRDVFGQTVKTYVPFESTVNEDLLSRMAKDTNGKYFRANKENSLGSVFSEIDQLEKTKIDVNKYTQYTELFPPYLLIGIFLYLISYLLNKTILRRSP